MAGTAGRGSSCWKLLRGKFIGFINSNLAVTGGVLLAQHFGGQGVELVVHLSTSKATVALLCRLELALLAYVHYSLRRLHF